MQLSDHHGQSFGPTTAQWAPSVRRALVVILVYLRRHGERESAHQQCNSKWISIGQGTHRVGGGEGLSVGAAPRCEMQRLPSDCRVWTCKRCKGQTKQHPILAYISGSASTQTPVQFRNRSKK